MAEYSFRLVDVTVTVKSNPGANGPRFLAVVTNAGDVLGKGSDYTEPGAVGLAILAARQAFQVCDGCGCTFWRDELVQDVAGLWYCGDCSWYQIVPER